MKNYLVTKLVDGQVVYCKRHGNSQDEVHAAELNKGITVLDVIEI